MSKIKLEFSVVDITREEIERRLRESLPEVDLIEVRDPNISTLRPSNRMEPFVYFVVAFAAHLAAGLAHDQLIKLIKKVFEDKGIKELNSKDSKLLSEEHDDGNEAN